MTHARLAQSVERTTLNRVVVGSSPTVGVALSFAPMTGNPRWIPLASPHCLLLPMLLAYYYIPYLTLLALVSLSFKLDCHGCILDLQLGFPARTASVCPIKWLLSTIITLTQDCGHCAKHIAFAFRWCGAARGLWRLEGELNGPQQYAIYCE